MEKPYRAAKKITETLNTLFSYVVKKIGILQYEDPTDDTSDISDSLLTAIAICKNHPSITVIKNAVKNLDSFNFHYVDESDIEKKIMNLSDSKASQDSVTPFKIIKDNLDIF